MKLIWLLIAALSTIVFVGGGAWVSATERRISAMEAKVLVLEERFTTFQRTQDATHVGVTEILRYMKRVPVSDVPIDRH